MRNARTHATTAWPGRRGAGCWLPGLIASAVRTEECQLWSAAAHFDDAATALDQADMAGASCRPHGGAARAPWARTPVPVPVRRDVGRG